MKHADILAKFLDLFWEQYGKDVCAYTPGGKDCVTIELKSGKTLQFICREDGTWELSGKEKV